MQDLMTMQNVDLGELSDSKVQQIKAVLEPILAGLQELEDDYNKVMAEEQTPEKCVRAKILRQDIAKTRIRAEKSRKASKREYLLAGKAIDGVYHNVAFVLGDKEAKLKEAEDYYQNQEQERTAKIQAERESELAKYNVVIKTPEILGRMSRDVWENYFNGAKLSCEESKEAQRKEAEERIKLDRSNRIWHERKELLAPYAQFGKYEIATNTTQAEFDATLKRLQAKKKEHEEGQARFKLENEKLKAEQQKLLQEKRLREKEQKRVLDEQKQKLLKEQQERENIEREYKAKEEQRKEAERKRALAPDKEKLLYFANALEKRKDTVESQEAKAAMSKAIAALKEGAGKL